MGRSVSTYSDDVIYIDYSKIEREDLKQLAEDGEMEFLGIRNAEDLEEAFDNNKYEILDRVNNCFGDMLWESFKEDITDRLMEMFPSLVRVPGTCGGNWIDNEGLVILANELVDVVLSEYCGLVALSLVPAEEANFELYRGCAVPQLAQHWIDQIFGKFSSLGNLYKIGTMSNGVGLYQRKE